MSPYITPPSKRGVTTHKDRQEVARSTLVKGIKSKMATLIWRAALGCLRWNCLCMQLGMHLLSGDTGGSADASEYPCERLE
jgi:hypothetical protein